MTATGQPTAETRAIDWPFTERERAQATLDSIGDAVVSTDFRGRVVYLNQAAERLTGFCQDAVAGLPLRAIFRLVNASGESVETPASASIIADQKRFAADNSLMIRRDGTLVSVEVSSTPIHDRLGCVVGAVVIARDTTVARQLSEKLARLALYDPLTGLPNRILFADRLEQAIISAKRARAAFSLLYIDLDHFKEINDELGHESGDQLLRIAADRMRQCMRKSDTVSRHGGDEFLALLRDCRNRSAAATSAAKILDTLRQPYDLTVGRVNLSATIGIAVFPIDATDRLALVRAADRAMYRAKSAGRSHLHQAQGHPSDVNRGHLSVQVSDRD